MAFDWLAFFNQHHIEYVTSGPSVTRGNVAIHCPFCGVDDPSHHMGVSLLGRGWRCWRQPGDHKGRNPVRLVQALIGCSIAEAKRITGTRASVPTGLLDRVKSLLDGDDAADDGDARGPEIPDTFQSLTNGLPSSRPYVKYLAERGYTHEMLAHFDEREIWYCSRGPWKGRIIFTLYHGGQLISWTGRTIWRDERILRYRTLPIDPEKAQWSGDLPALAPISHHLLWFDQLMEADADTIVLNEGPFDALHVDLIGQNDGVAATCLFTAEPTEPQIDQLRELLPRFKRRYLLLDAETVPTTMRVSAALAALNVVPRFLPPHIKDPGERGFTAEILHRTLAGKI